MGVFMVIVILVAISVVGGALSGVVGGVFGGIPMIIIVVAIIVLGGVLREFAKSARNLNSASRKDMEEIKQRISQIEVDIADIKELIADVIISQV
jgi:ABC-type multidrug transport system fused ATPase/permease subunit